MTTRYDLYLLGALGEVHRLQSRPDLARQCFQQVRDTAQVLGIPGWQAHGSLGLAEPTTQPWVPQRRTGPPGRRVFVGTRRSDTHGAVCPEALSGTVCCEHKAPTMSALSSYTLALAEEADRLDYRYHHCRILAALEHHDDIEFSIAVSLGCTAWVRSSGSATRAFGIR